MSTIAPTTPSSPTSLLATKETLLTPAGCCQFLKKLFFAGEYQSTIRAILLEVEKRKLNEMTAEVFLSEYYLIKTLLDELKDLVTYTDLEVHGSNGSMATDVASYTNTLENLSDMVTFLEENFDYRFGKEEKKDGFFIGAILMENLMTTPDLSLLYSAERQLILEGSIVPFENLNDIVNEKVQMRIGQQNPLVAFAPAGPNHRDDIYKLLMQQEITYRDVLIGQRMKSIKLQLVNYHRRARQHFGTAGNQYMKWKSRLYVDLTKLDSQLSPYSTFGNFLVSVLILFISVGLPLLAAISGF